MRILYCDVDTLRADHTGPYGYSRTITPNLDAIAAGGVVIDSCYASDSPCAPSRAAWTSGQFGITTGAIGNFGPAADIGMFTRTRHAPFFGNHLYRNGIHTASVTSFPERHYAYWFLANFLEWVKPSLSGGDDEDAADVTAMAESWLRRRGREDDWFLHVHYWDAHIPYMEQRPYFELAEAAGEPPAWPDEEAIALHARMYGPHSALDLYEGDGSWRVPSPRSPNPVTMPDAITSRADFVKLVTGYDGAIAYWDHHLGRLLDVLADLGVLEDTAVIVTSDHGECFGENGCYGDHPMANEPSHHVPLVIRWPGITDGVPEARRHAPGLVSHVDICPTICELLDIPVPGGWDGESFAPAVRGEEYAGRDYVVLSHGAYTYQRAIRTPESLYIRTLHPGCFKLDREQLYDIATDPHMTQNLVSQKAATAAELAGRLEQWRLEHATMAGPTPDPMEARRYEGPADAFDVKAYLTRLRLTDRGDLADDLERRLGEGWVTRAKW
ncbi:MAG: sulfatase [Acidimicrobiales bacterium]